MREYLLIELACSRMDDRTKKTRGKHDSRSILPTCRIHALARADSHHNC